MAWLNIFLIVVSVLLATTILLQQRGAGSSAMFGGGGGDVYHTKRGMEKVLFISTIILAVLFVGTAFIRLFF